jgi:hypothetical protein
VQAAIVASGGVAGGVAASSSVPIFAAAGMTTGAGCTLVGGAFLAGYGVGSGINEVLPDQAKEGIGDAELWVLGQFGYSP